MGEKLLLVFKYIAGFFVLPLTIFATLHFQKEMRGFPSDICHFFILGLVGFLLVHVFVAGMPSVFEGGKECVRRLFSFLPLLGDALSWALPFYAIVVVVGYGFLRLVGYGQDLMTHVMFFIGFSLSLHFVYCAQSLREQTKNLVHPDYLLGMQGIYLFNLGLLGLFFGQVSSLFSVVRVFHLSCDATWGLYLSIYRQLFVP